MNECKTPCYIIDKVEFDSLIKEYRKIYTNLWSDHLILGYSVKTNHFPWLIKYAGAHGWYAEVVSYDELQYVKSLGFDDSRIIFNGPQKNCAVLDMLNTDCIINVDNLQELEAIVSSEHKCSLGLRVNFDLEQLCPGETTCGAQYTPRFGICLENGDFEKALILMKKNNMFLSGLHIHTSTSSRSLVVYKAICDTVISIAKQFNLEFAYIDIGGGFFGGNYFPNKPTVFEYASVITDTLKTYFDPKRVTLVLEPGAGILATAVNYLTSVHNIREIRGQKIVTMDGTSLHINSFMKPYQKTPCTIIDGGSITSDTIEVVGNTCMEMDRFYPRDMNCDLTMNSKIIFHCAGAYTMTHNSTFINTLPNVYVNDNGHFELVRDKNISYIGN